MPDHLKVMAVHAGFYNLGLRRAGDVFTLKDAADYQRAWMRRVASTVPDARRRRRDWRLADPPEVTP